MLHTALLAESDVVFKSVSLRNRCHQTQGKRAHFDGLSSRAFLTKRGCRAENEHVGYKSTAQPETLTSWMVGVLLCMEYPLLCYIFKSSSSYSLFVSDGNVRSSHRASTETPSFAAIALSIRSDRRRPRLTMLTVDRVQPSSAATAANELPSTRSLIFIDSCCFKSKVNLLYQAYKRDTVFTYEDFVKCSR